MHLIDILNIPARYRDRYNKVRSVILNNFEIEKTENYRIFRAVASNKYTTQIAFPIDTEITAQSIIKVDCGCKSFLYEFSEVIERSDGLFVVRDYKKKSSKMLTLTGCKHLIALGKYIFERRTIFDD
jgi:hypothetical protein